MESVNTSVKAYGSVGLKTRPSYCYLRVADYYDRKNLFSLGVAAWPSGSVLLTWAERRPTGWFSLYKGYCTVDQLLRFWGYLTALLLDCRRQASIAEILEELL